MCDCIENNKKSIESIYASRVGVDIKITLPLKQDNRGFYKINFIEVYKETEFKTVTADTKVFGSLKIKFCPFCGEQLKPKQ